MCVPSFGPDDSWATLSDCGAPPAFVVKVSLVLALDGVDEPQARIGTKTTSANQDLLRCRMIATTFSNTMSKMVLADASFSKA
jgi:hypothetical protein